MAYPCSDEDSFAAVSQWFQYVTFVAAVEICYYIVNQFPFSKWHKVKSLLFLKVSLEHFNANTTSELSLYP